MTPAGLAVFFDFDQNGFRIQAHKKRLTRKVHNERDRSGIRYTDRWHRYDGDDDH
jgi:hypothetical protein